MKSNNQISLEKKGCRTFFSLFLSTRFVMSSWSYTEGSLCFSQSWADAFRTSPSLGGVVYVYDDLRRRGLEFPMTDLDALSPIHTPSRVSVCRVKINSLHLNCTMSVQYICRLLSNGVTIRAYCMHCVCLSVHSLPPDCARKRNPTVHGCTSSSITTTNSLQLSYYKFYTCISAH